MKTVTGDSSGKYTVPAFARGLRLLELLSAHPEGLRMSDMDVLRLPSATLFRMLSTLTESGYALRETSGVYRLSRKLLKLARSPFENAMLTEAAAEPMRRLRDATGESAMLGILYGGEGIVLEQLPSNQPVKVVLQIGHHFPLHSAAPAKAVLAFLPESEREEMIRGIRFTPFTEATLRSAKELKKQLETVRMEGVAYDFGEELPDIRCAAAPVCDSTRRCVGALWISGPASRLPEDRLRECGMKVREAALETSGKL